MEREMVQKSYNDFLSEVIEATTTIVKLHKPNIFSTTSHKNGTVDEIDFFMANNAQLIKQRTDSIRKNLIRKLKAGKYDHKQAPKLWMLLIDEGTKRFMKENDITQNIKDFFPKNDRMLFAEQLADEFILEVSIGQWDSLGGLKPGEINLDIKD